MDNRKIYPDLVEGYEDVVGNQAPEAGPRTEKVHGSGGAKNKKRVSLETRRKKRKQQKKARKAGRK